jgi:hypothetical protein
MRPQSSVVMSQRFWHHTDEGVGEQQLLLPRQTPLSGHVAGQFIVWPQLFVTVALHLPAQAATLPGVQHVPSAMHTSLPDAHPIVALGPHGTR